MLEKDCSSNDGDVVGKNCDDCVFHFRRLKELDRGVLVPEDICVRIIKNPIKCEHYTRVWVKPKKRR